MIVPLSQIFESADRTRIYFVILDQQICLPPEKAVGSIWNSTQLGAWASKGQVIVVQKPAIHSGDRHHPRGGRRIPSGLSGQARFERTDPPSTQEPQRFPDQHP